MDKNKLLIPASIIIGATILGGFYFGTTSNPTNSPDTFVQKQKCQELGSQYEEELINNESSLDYIYLGFIRIVYAYSAKHDTCVLLYSYDYYVNNEITGQGGVIVDLLENKELARYLDAINEYGEFGIDPQRQAYTNTEIDYFFSN